MATAALPEFTATGRRKTSVARVRLTEGVGKIFVNGKEFSVYFPDDSLRAYIEQPLNLLNAKDSFDVQARLDGGGLAGQAGALRHGISRALVEANAEHREILKSNGCLTRDDRMKERKKPGQPGARKRFQFSKR
ncbi:MAG: 30S ribosomal protein S9 [Verrucomicrobia bacterium]|nr:30S ribosomal protein S9 [Verrucomicrobiota bacterium]MCH8512098.1 30S ribosomal protein S9 [Kiritimatiellia bacterium]